jgi:hypothetical protein
MNIIHRDNSKGRHPRRHKLEKPHGRKQGRYQFLKGWNEDGSANCIDVTPQALADHLFSLEGNGNLLDDGVNLWWVQDSNKR